MILKSLKRKQLKLEHKIVFSMYMNDETALPLLLSSVPKNLENKVFNRSYEYSGQKQKKNVIDNGGNYVLFYVRGR